MTERTGKVYIMGAGPGCMGLISVKGLKILQECDCVLYDRLIGREILNLISEDAERIYVGKEHHSHIRTQNEINKLLINNAKKHSTVVRLKGGDPMVFGRATEEIMSLVENKIDFEIVPGLTAIAAAAACAGIILTDRNTASSLTLVTGQSAEGKLTKIDFTSLVKLEGTIVFYMTVENMRMICRKLIKAGMAKEMNAIVVANASLANQKIIMGKIGDIAKKCELEKVEPPAVLIIGEKCVSLLKHQELFGKKVLITRDESGNAEFACKLAARGAQAIDCPIFEIQDLTRRKDFKEITGKIKNYDWVFFTSATGVKLFFEAANRLRMDSRVFGDVKIACIGCETENELKLHGIRADFVPKKFTSAELAKEFIKKYKPEGTKILLLRSSLAENLEIRGASADTFAVYTLKKIKNTTKRNKHGADWVTFASSFAAKCFFEKFKAEEISGIKIASIGPVTSGTLRRFGIEPTVEAEVHTIDGMIDEMERHGKLRANSE